MAEAKIPGNKIEVRIPPNKRADIIVSLSSALGQLAKLQYRKGSTTIGAPISLKAPSGSSFEASNEEIQCDVYGFYHYFDEGYLPSVEVVFLKNTAEQVIVGFDDNGRHNDNPDGDCDDLTVTFNFHSPSDRRFP